MLETPGTLMAWDSNGDSNPIQYRVSFREANSHRVEIEATIPTDGEERVTLMMPVWTPGSYLIREYPRQIEGIAARNGLTNESLRIDKSDKNHWVVECPGASEIVVEYVLYGREMGVRTNWIENEFAFLTGAATFLTREDALDRPHRVKLDALPHWADIATSLAMSDPRQPWTRTARNYDDLVDSPIVLGNIDIATETIGSAVHHLATLGTDDLWDNHRAMKDVAKIVEVEQAFWGEVPYSEYWFLNLATESGGGLEHDNSCVLMMSRWSQRQRSKYVDWLALVSHEFFHAWNVRRLRPRTLKSYDYNSEQYFRELWIAEGLTSYYDNLFVARAGLCSPKEYLDRLNKQVQSLQNAPGRLVQNLEDSSYDTWIKFYRPDENANNSRISYYLKGAMVGLLLDAEIRLRTDNRHSLDDCMRLLWQRHRETGYDNADFVAVVDSIVGESMQDWFSRQLNTTEELDFSKVQACYGLQWKAKEVKDKSAEPDATPPTTPASIGLDLSNQAGRGVLEKLPRGSAAAAAGLQVGDELIGWDGYRVTPEIWSDRLASYRAGDRVVVNIARRGKLLSFTIEIPTPSTDSWNLVRIEQPSPEQEQRWRSWLGLPEPETEPNASDSTEKAKTDSDLASGAGNP